MKQSFLSFQINCIVYVKIKFSKLFLIDDVKINILNHLVKIYQTKPEHILPENFIDIVNHVQIDTRHLLKDIEKEEMEKKRIEKKSINFHFFPVFRKEKFLVKKSKIKRKKKI